MEKRKILTEADMEAIISGKFYFGKKAEQIAVDTGVGKTFVFNLCSAYTAVKNEDWEKASHMLRKGAPMKHFEWAAKSLGKTLPASFGEEETKEAPPAPPVEPSAPPLAAPTAPSSSTTNEVVYFIRIIEELHNLNENLSNLMDADLPKLSEEHRLSTVRVASVLCEKLSPLVKDVANIKEAIK